MIAALWRARGTLARRAGTPAFSASLVALGLGAGLVVASVAADYELWWAIGAGLMGAVQVGAAVVAARS